MFDMIDANCDGFVDKKEYMAFAQKRYAAFDSNGNRNDVFISPQISTIFGINFKRFLSN